VLEIGINNYAQDKMENFGSKYRQLLNILPPDTPIVAMAIMPINRHADSVFSSTQAAPAIRRSNQEIAFACGELPHCHFLDISPALSDSAGYLQFQYDVGDGIHLSEQGYKIWASALVPLMPKEPY
jgi:lysophospholipase L1-like esterase